MINSLADFELRLQSMNPEADDFVLLVDMLLLETSPSIADSIYKPILRFFAAHPSSDCGGLTSLTHHIENFYPNYAPALLESLRESPSWNGVLLLNRILNANISKEEQMAYFDILRHVTSLQDTDQTVAELAQRYLQRHSSTS